MSKAFDAIIFGATGFTGKFVLENAVEIFKDLRWAIAGRNLCKLELALHEVGQKLQQNLSQIPIILADVDDQESLNAMALRSKVILNCVGPYMLYGERVVRACVQHGTHHVDLSAEPQYTASMQLKYHKEAQQNGSYIISTCAYESVPADLGVIYAADKFEGTINSIEAYLENSVDYKDKSSRAVLHHSTYDSFLEVVKNVGELVCLQRKAQEEMLLDCKPKLRLKFWLQKPSQLHSYFLPFPADRAIVQQTQHLLEQSEQKRPIQYESYGGFSSLLITLLVPMYILLLGILAQFNWTFRLLKKYPNFFSFGLMTHAGPKLSNMDGHYFTITFKAMGWSKQQSLTETPTKEQWTRVSGQNPYYGTTSVILLMAALTLIKECDKMPGSGGVLTPGFAFAKTSYINKLSQSAKYPLKFEIISTTD